MPRLVPLVFPFRRLGLWLAALVLLVGLLALAVSAVVVVPFLEQRLLDDRVSRVDHAAEQSAPALARQLSQSPYQADQSAAAVGQLTGTTVYLYNVLGTDQLSPISAPVGPTDDPVARDAATRATGRRVSRLVTRNDQRYAESAVSLQSGQLVALYVQSAEDAASTADVLSRRLLIAGVIALPIAALVGLLAAYALVGRIRRLERAAHRIARGEFDEPVVDDGNDELTQLASAFDDMRERLASTDRARREFIANASHELRTPLFALGGYLELIEDDPDDPAATAEFVSEMRGQVDRLTRLATDLLDLSRLDAGRLDLHREPVELGEVARLVASEFGPRADQRGSTVAVDGFAVGLADERRVAQVVRALVENALRHNPEGSAVRLHAEVVARPGDGGRAVLAVHDDGPAIADADRARIFGRFERASGGEGSGIGLAIAHELATRMDGELRLEQNGMGKAFVLDLPASADDADALEAAR